MTHIFIHAAILPLCKERLIQYISSISESGLLEAATNIHICCVGGGDLPIDATTFSEYDVDKKIRIYHLSPELSVYELPTLQFLYQFSRENRECKILYIHTKNVGKEVNVCIEDQIKYMLYFLIGKWRMCIESLDTYNSCGVDLREFPTLHYSGNFWWATSKYIATLPSPNEFHDIQKYPNPLNSIRHNQEFWICFDKTEHLHSSLWDCEINCYERHLHRYTPEKYILL